MSLKRNQNREVRSKRKTASWKDAATDKTASWNDAATGSTPLSPQKPWFNIRLVVLVIILLVLSSYGFLHQRYRQAKARIQESIMLFENRRAIGELASFEKSYGEMPETHFLRARVFRHMDAAEDFRRAIEAAKQANYPLKKLVNEERLFQAKQGSLPDVELQLSKMLEEGETEFEEVGMALVYALLAQHQFQTVVDFLAIWESQQPKSPWVPLFRGMLALSRREWKVAKDVLEAGIVENPGFVPFYRHVGSAYNGLNESDQACAAFRRYLKSEPEDLDTMLSLAVGLSKSGKADEVLELLQPLIASNKASIEIRLQLAKSYLEKSEPQKCVDVLLETAKTWPEDVATASYLSQAYQQLGNQDHATFYSKIADAGQPDIQAIDPKLFKLISNPGSTAQECYELGHIFLHKQSRENGVYWLNTALRIDEKYVPAHEDLALYYTRTKQPSLAAMHQRLIEKYRKQP